MTRIFSLIIVCMLMLFNSRISAQQAMQSLTLSGNIKSDKAEQMEINLFDADQKLIKTEIADNSGKFNFNDLKEGTYQVKLIKTVLRFITRKIFH